MKITIDTVQDSKDDIRKAIKLLQEIIGEASSGVETVKQDFNFGGNDGEANIFGALGGDDDSTKEKSPDSAITDMFGNKIEHEEPEKKKRGLFNIEIVDDF